MLCFEYFESVVPQRSAICHSIISLPGISVLALLKKKLFYIMLSMFPAILTLLHQSVVMQI